MATTMDENTVTANLVTFINCLSLAERKSITKYLFCNKDFFLNSSETEKGTKIAEFEETISNAKKLNWEISYHTQVFQGCEPDVVIYVDETRFYIEVKINNGARFTDSEKKNGAREQNNLKENHVYLVPANYDLSEKIPGSPVCRWGQLKEYMCSEEIDCERFFNEIGKYIQDFNQESHEFTKKDIVMLYEPEYVNDVLIFINKIKKLIDDCDNEIIQKLSAYEKTNFLSGPFYGSYKTIKMIKYKGKDWDMGYGYNSNTPDYDAEKDVKGCDFNVFVRPEFIKCKTFEENTHYKNKFGYSYFPLDKKIFNETDYEKLKQKFINEVVKKFKSILCLDDKDSSSSSDATV